ncbi:MAG: DUF255 domain-containing protein [Chitinophagales bacterium]|nr:DUF255 domain-containing protein [Chitinophagales bacterium]
MKKLFFATALFCAFAFAPFILSAQTPPKLVKWLTMQEAIELNKKQPRKIFIDVYTDWCGWCKKMDAVTFENPIVAKYLNERYYPVQFNAEVRDSIFFREKQYAFVTEGSRGYHELAVELMQGKMSYPTVVFLDEQLKNIQAIPGFREAPEMDRILKYFGDNFYRNTDYQIFQSNYVSPFTEANPMPGN